MAAVALITGWFAAGSFWNVRKGNATLRWMEGGLPLVGERTTLRWLGTTSVEMVIANARPPFAKVTLVIFLEPRDVPWIWGPSRLRGRRDTLILRAQLRRHTVADLEVIDLPSWSGRDARPLIASERWSIREPKGPGDLPLFYKLEGALPVADALLELAKGSGMTVRRLSVRRQEPQLHLHVDLPSASAKAADFFGAFRAMGERAARL